MIKGNILFIEFAKALDRILRDRVEILQLDLGGTLSLSSLSLFSFSLFLSFSL